MNENPLDEYFRLIAELKLASLNSGQDLPYFLDQLSNLHDQRLERLIELQAEFTTANDCDRVIGLLAIGFFKNRNNSERLACYLIENEIQKIRTRDEIEHRCRPYSAESDLFRNCPQLLKLIRDQELIELSALSQESGSEIMKTSNGYAKLDGFLNPFIVEWSMKEFKNTKIYARCLQDYYSLEKPLQVMNEEILMPANPSWWKYIELFRYQTTGASYFLQDCAISKETFRKYWEYNVQKLRSLQFHAKRYNDGRLSMCFEELSTNYEDVGFLFGRYIHFDTDCPVGTPITSAFLLHLDLAVNFYQGDSIQQRLSGDLAKGHVIDATIRTHLFRIENIPLLAFVAYVLMFMKSDTMKSEWLSDQFGKKSI
jgi:hypothetical protein